MDATRQERAASTDAAEAVRGVRRWYHSIDVAPGVSTPGVFDLRPIVDRLPWPELGGKRCLDVGTSDGFLAFELERRGAAEVVATDIADHTQWDWEPRSRQSGLAYLDHVVGPDMGAGFEVARRLLGSKVRREQANVYDLAPERIGTFDVVVCGSLLLHLRDPLRALEAIGSVCAGELLLTNQIDFGRSLYQRRRPLVRLDGSGTQTQWWLPNVAANRQLVIAAGFRILRDSRPYCIPYGPSHPRPARRLGPIIQSLSRRLLTGHDGVPHHAILAAPETARA